jgi:hypothetical protein
MLSGLPEVVGVVASRHMSGCAGWGGCAQLLHSGRLCCLAGHCIAVLLGLVHIWMALVQHCYSCSIMKLLLHVVICLASWLQVEWG